MEAHSLLLLDGSSNPLSQKYSRSSGAFHNMASTNSAEDPRQNDAVNSMEKRMQPSLATNAFRLATYASQLVGSQRTRAAYSQVTTERTASRLVQQ